VTRDRFLLDKPESFNRALLVVLALIGAALIVIGCLW